MSLGGGQWRVLRHLLSLTNLQGELDKLLQRVRPALSGAAASPQHWENVLRRLEKALSTRLMQESKEIESKPAALENTKPRAADGKADRPSEVAAGEQLASPPGEVTVGSPASDITVEGLLQGLRRKKDLALGNISQPTWRTNKPLVNKSSIHSRTSYVIAALAGAQSAACRVKRAEDLVHHLHQYPEARDLAIKEGAVRALLRVRHAAARDEDARAADELRGVVHEALALLGWVGAPRGPGPNVLSLDGGGIRGLIAIEILRHLERLSGRPVHELFDYIIGVSTGAIIAAVIGGGVGSLETAGRMYRTLSREMFGNTSVIGGTSRLVWTHSYYDTAQWERLLRERLGELTLSQCNRRASPHLALVSCAVTAGARPAPFVFRTYGAGYRRRGAVRGTSAARVWQAVRASAAAPTYFDEYRLAGDVHHDGGIVANNPCGVGVHEARLLYGGDALARGTVVSVGTGQPLAAPAPAAAAAPPATSWRDKFNKILESATDTEGVHLVVNELLPAGSYFRFNPPLLEACNMDEVDPVKLQNMITDTHAYIRRNQHKFEQAAARLCRSRGVLQRVADAVQHRALLLGLTTHN